MNINNDGRMVEVELITVFGTWVAMKGDRILARRP